MTSSPKTPMTAEESKVRLVKAAKECTKGVLLSFVMGEDTEGKPQMQPRVNSHDMDITTIIAAFDIMHQVQKSRMEYIVMDYVRLLKQERANENPSDEVPNDETGGES